MRRAIESCACRPWTTSDLCVQRALARLCCVRSHGTYLMTITHASRCQAGCLVSSNCWRLERQRAEDPLRSHLDTIQRLTQSVRVAVVELNVVGRVDARPDADRCADDERHGLCFGLSYGFARGSV